MTALLAIRHHFYTFFHQWSSSFSILSGMNYLSHAFLPILTISYLCIHFIKHFSLICFPCVWSDSLEFLSLATSLIMLAPVSSNVAQFLKIQDSAIEFSKQVINFKVIFVFVHYEIQARSPIAENPKKNVTDQ